MSNAIERVVDEVLVDPIWADEIKSFYENVINRCLFSHLRIDCFGKDRFEFAINNAPCNKRGRLYYLEMSPAGGHLGHLAFHGKTVYYHQYGELFTAEEIFRDAVNNSECPVSLFIDELYDHDGNEMDINSGSVKLTYRKPTKKK